MNASPAEAPLPVAPERLTSLFAGASAVSYTHLDVYKRQLQALVLGPASPETLLALGFQNIADNAAKIGEFNFSPDLLRQLAKQKA